MNKPKPLFGGEDSILGMDESGFTVHLACCLNNAREPETPVIGIDDVRALTKTRLLEVAGVLGVPFSVLVPVKMDDVLMESYRDEVVRRGVVIVEFGGGHASSADHVCLMLQCDALDAVCAREPERHNATLLQQHRERLHQRLRQLAGPDDALFSVPQDS